MTKQFSTCPLYREFKSCEIATIQEHVASVASEKQARQAYALVPHPGSDKLAVGSQVTSGKTAYSLSQCF
jgi:hypothetical protein